jgi:hypothetical protein
LRRKTNRKEVGRYFRDWLDTSFRNGLIDRHNREEILDGMQHHLPAIVADLNHRGRAHLDLRTGAFSFFLREGKDPTHGKFSLF